MNPRLARLLTRLYPPHWRERYGEEFQTLLEMGPSNVRTIANSIRSALREHIIPTRGHPMTQNPNSFSAMIKELSAFLPLTMSLLALLMVLGDVATYSVIHGGIQGLNGGPDENSTAHIWQILMTAQIPIVAFFAIKWLPRAPRQTLPVLALQTTAWLTSCAAVFFFHLG
jgi:hypothetical protein